MNPRRWLDVLLGVGVATGVVARLVRYFDARSLWNDEAGLALNVWSRDASALLGPLDYGQSAPYGFLLLERLALVVLGPAELALRSIPLLASLAALPLFWHVARVLLPARDARVALLLFATCEPLVFYASELKQYSLDVLVVLGLLALGLRTARAALDARSALCFGAAGAGALWLSHPAAFVCAALGIGLAVRELRRGRPGAVPWLVTIAALQAASFALLYGLQLQPALDHPYLREFWSGAFAPMPPVSLADWAWYPRTLAGFFVDPVGLPPWWLALPAALVGAWRLAVSKPLALWWLIGPLALALVASMLELYPLRTWPPVELGARLFPFAGRLWLFAVPAVLLLVAHGIAALGGLGRRGDLAIAVALIGVAGLSLRQLVVNVWAPPTVQEFRPVALQLRDRVDRADHVWVQRGSEPTFEYYSRLLALPVRAHNVGASEPEQVASLERGLRALEPGERIWLVALHHPAWRNARDLAALAERIRRHAREVSHLAAPGASAVEFVVEEIAPD